MNISIFDPTTKMLLQMARITLDNVLDRVIAANAGTHQVADAVRAAKVAVDGALDQLIALQRETAEHENG